MNRLRRKQNLKSYAIHLSKFQTMQPQTIKHSISKLFLSAIKDV